MRQTFALVATGLMLMASAAAAHAAPVASVLGIPCTTQTDGVQACIGVSTHRVPTWDGVPLDVDIYLPPAAQEGPFPTIFFLHGFGGSKSGPWRLGRARGTHWSSTRRAGSGTLAGSLRRVTTLHASMAGLTW